MSASFSKESSNCSQISLQSVPINLRSISRSRSWAQPRNRTIENDQNPDRRSTTYGRNGLGNNLGTERAEHGVKRGIRADQKAKRVNNLAFSDPDCKTSTPGSNPGGASNFIQQIQSFSKLAREGKARHLWYHVGPGPICLIPFHGRLHVRAVIVEIARLANAFHVTASTDSFKRSSTTRTSNNGCGPKLKCISMRSFLMVSR